MNFTHTYRSALNSCAFVLAAGAISIASSHAQEAPAITSISVNEAGRIVIQFDGTNGEYLLEGNDDLTATEAWGTLCRLTSDGGSSTVSEPIDAESGKKFFRIQTIPASDESALTGTMATEFDTEIKSSPIIYGDLQSMFGLSAASNEVALTTGSDLSSASVQDRLYTSILGGLSLLAQSILDTTTFPATQPTEADIVEALLLDLKDGVFDGDNSGTDIQIGSTGVDLPDDLVDQDFLDHYAQLKTDVQSLYNVSIAANADPASGFTFSVPATWGSFYWDSAAWQAPSE